MNYAGFISEKEFREWQVAVAMQYGIEADSLQDRDDSKKIRKNSNTKETTRASGQ